MASGPPRRPPQHLAQVCRVFPQVGFEAYHQDEVYTFRPNAITQKHLARCHLTGQPRAIGDMPTPWIKVILQHPDTKVLEGVQAYLLAQWPQVYDVTFSNPTLLEVTSRGPTRACRCCGWPTTWGVSREHIYCVGNGMNDIPMLEVSALSFAPANSYDQVLAAADIILPSCDESCVARMIEVLEQRYRK